MTDDTTGETTDHGTGRESLTESMVRTHSLITEQLLADTLNAAVDSSTVWADGYIEVGGERLLINRSASDALAARLGHADQNESQSRWMVVGTEYFLTLPISARAIGLEVEYVDGRGWQPVGNRSTSL